MRLLAAMLAFAACSPGPCLGPSGIFAGELRLHRNTCGEYVALEPVQVEIEVSEPQECTEVQWNFSSGAGPHENHEWCEHELLTTIEPSGEGYTGRQYYELMCIEPHFHCLAETRTEFR